MALGRWMVAGLVGILALGSTALAQDDQGAQGQGHIWRTRRQPRQMQARGPLAGLEERMTRELKLTEDQQKQVKQILDTHKQDLANWTKENAEKQKTLREKFAQARTDRNTEAMTSLRAEMRKLAEPRLAMRTKLIEQLKGVLTDEQKPKLDALIAARQPRAAMSMADRLRRAVRRLRLDEKQAKPVEKIIKTTEADVKKVKTEQGKTALWSKAVEDIKAIIGQEKATQLDAALRASARNARQPGAMFANLKLTPEQTKKVEDIMAEARKKAAEGERGQRREIYQAAMEKITKEVLTPEQAKEYEKQRQERRERFRRGRRRRGGNRQGGQNTEGGASAE